jgi:hypothetical protein
MIADPPISEHKRREMKVVSGRGMGGNLEVAIVRANDNSNLSELSNAYRAFRDNPINRVDPTGLADMRGNPLLSPGPTYREAPPSWAASPGGANPAPLLFIAPVPANTAAAARADASADANLAKSDSC